MEGSGSVLCGLGALAAAALLIPGEPADASHSLSPKPVASVSSLGDHAADLTLSIHQGNNLGGKMLVTVSLECLPTGGTHPKATDACNALKAVNGDFAALPRAKGMCYFLVAPVTVHATGRWFGHPVSFTHSYSNRCLAGDYTNEVFEF
jgi:Subtilisin inhibitor-like